MKLTACSSLVFKKTILVLVTSLHFFCLLACFKTGLFLVNFMVCWQLCDCPSIWSNWLMIICVLTGSSTFRIRTSLRISIHKLLGSLPFCVWITSEWRTNTTNFLFLLFSQHWFWSIVSIRRRGRLGQCNCWLWHAYHWQPK